MRDYGRELTTGSHSEANKDWPSNGAISSLNKTVGVQVKIEIVS